MNLSTCWERRFLEQYVGEILNFRCAATPTQTPTSRSNVKTATDCPCIDSPYPGCLFRQPRHQHSLGHGTRANLFGERYEIARADKMPEMYPRQSVQPPLVLEPPGQHQPTGEIIGLFVVPAAVILRTYPRWVCIVREHL